MIAIVVWRLSVFNHCDEALSLSYGCLDSWIVLIFFRRISFCLLISMSRSMFLIRYLYETFPILVWRIQILAVAVILSLQSMPFFLIFLCEADNSMLFSKYLVLRFLLKYLAGWGEVPHQNKIINLFDYYYYLSQK